VTEDHLSFDGNCGVRAEPCNLPAAGDPTVYGPPFPLTSSISHLMLSAGVRTPRNFMAPNTCDGTYCCGEALQPDVGPATSTAMVLVLRLRGAGTAERGRGPVGSAPSPRAGGSSALLTILRSQRGKR
jgi:hypothetical protein